VAFSVFLFGFILLIGDGFSSKSASWLVYPACSHHRSWLFEAFDRRAQIGTDRTELFRAKQQHDDDGNNQLTARY
jgi:hypothetical protein